VDVYGVLRQAILNKTPCIIAKSGEPERKICPYRLGLSGKGDRNVIYYQYEGYTSNPRGLSPDGSQDNWRCNHVSDIVKAEEINEAWHEPTVKPRTRGRCVVVQDVEVVYYD
jgi:hypothetical protein